MHKNICRGISKWDRVDNGSTRDFPNEYKMTRHVIDQINEHVKWDHHLFINGDFLFQSRTPQSYIKFIEQIDCDNIYFISGNHDNPDNLLEAMMIMEAEGKRKKIQFIGDYLEIQIDGRMLCLMHYPIENWNNRNKVSWHLHGHVHGRFNDKQPEGRLDVGLDSALKILGELRPFNWKEIIKILS